MTHDDVCPVWERKVAGHVEQLISLGWRWEGRGLVPSVGAWHVTDVDSQDKGSQSRVTNETLQRCHLSP